MNNRPDRVTAVYARRIADAIKAVEVRLSDLFSEEIALPRFSHKGREHLTMLQWEALQKWLAEKKSKSDCTCTPSDPFVEAEVAEVEIEAEVPEGLSLEGAQAEVEVEVVAATLVEDSNYERALIGVEGFEPIESDPEAASEDAEPPLPMPEMSAEANEIYIRYNGTAHKHLMRVVQARGLAGRLPIPEKGNYVRKDHLIRLLMEDDGYTLP